MRSLSALFLFLIHCSLPAFSVDLPPANIQTLQMPSGINDFIWDSASSRFLVASGTNVLVVDPDAVSIERTIAIGETTGRIAVSLSEVTLRTSEMQTGCEGISKS